MQSFGIKCNRALALAKQNSPEIHKRFKTNAAYLDVNSCVPPWHQLDHEAGQPMAAMALAKVKFDTELFQFLRDTHEGPMLGEGNKHFYWAGLCDGVEAQVDGGEHHVPLLDFDLLKIHPQMVNHGMGYYERWFEEKYGARWGHDVGTVEDVDKYRAMEVAYGHAGFIGNLQADNVQWVAKEHHLMHPIQRLAGTAKVTAIHYEVDGTFVSVGVALVLGERLRQRICYDGGLTVWVNWREEPWNVEGRILPQWGFLALGPNTEVCTTLRDGKFTDYAECPEYLFADARTSFHMPYVDSEKNIEPRLAHFEHVSGGKIRLAYEWIVNDTLDQDYACFVHFIHKQKDRVDHIVFQQDHSLPKSTSQWQKGEAIADGPYEITVPGEEFDTYDIVIGLHQEGARMALKGVQESGGRIFIGRLRLHRAGDRIEDVTLDDFATVARSIDTPQADFTARLNPTGTRINFGKISTNGSVKVSKEKKRLVVFPYPRDEAFTVAFDMNALAPQAFQSRKGVQTRALAAGTQADLGKVKQTVQDGWLTFDVGLKGAGRYVVEW